MPAALPARSGVGWVITEAEATIKYAILDGIVGQYHKKDDPNFIQLIRDKIFDEIFRPQYRWALEEHLAKRK